MVTVTLACYIICFLGRCKKGMEVDDEFDDGTDVTALAKAGNGVNEVCIV